VVSGIRTPQPISELEQVMPKAYKELREDHVAAREALQGRPGLRVHDPGRHLYMLQTRNGKRTGYAAVRIATEIVPRS
jgi:pyruvate, orthophosphate dikinase